MYTIYIHKLKDILHLLYKCVSIIITLLLTLLCNKTLSTSITNHWCERGFFYASSAACERISNHNTTHDTRHITHRTYYYYLLHHPTPSLHTSSLWCERGVFIKQILPASEGNHIRTNPHQGPTTIHDATYHIKSPLTRTYDIPYVVRGGFFYH